VPQVEEIFITMIRLLTRHERVELLVDDAETEEQVRRRLRSALAVLENLRVHRIPTVDSWIRDYGPNFLLRRRGGCVEAAFNHWDFNAWGGKYEELKLDAKIPAELAPRLDIPCFRPGIVLEGGSIDVNGAGVCLTTDQCLLNPNRNPRLSRGEIERYLRGYLGVEKVVWLGEGIIGDDTDGHVDDFARFVGSETVVLATEDDPSDPNFEVLKDNRRRLTEARDLAGRPFRIVELPMPARVDGPEGRLPASYANFYIANRLVLTPVFGHARDEQALTVLRGLFPERQVVGIPCEPLIWGLGAIHCVTQQQPACE
jgi:agmatine deiminase